MPTTADAIAAAAAAVVAAAYCAALLIHTFHRVVLSEGVDYVRTASVKDQIELSGNDINSVSNTAARISQACTVKNKDIRKFLDGESLCNES